MPPPSSRSRPLRMKTATRRPEWDDTVSDLTVYRATPQEMEKRRENSRSSNETRPWSRGSGSHNAMVTREVLSPWRDIHDVLSKSDQTLVDARGAFGERLFRHTGFPAVTRAPGVTSYDPLLASPPPCRTQLSLLSESVMATRALNDIGSEAEHHWKGSHDPRSIQSDEDLDVTPSSQPNPHGAALNNTEAVQRVASRLCQGESKEDGGSLPANNDHTLPQKDSRHNNSNNNSSIDSSSRKHSNFEDPELASKVHQLLSRLEIAVKECGRTDMGVSESQASVSPDARDLESLTPKSLSPWVYAEAALRNLEKVTSLLTETRSEVSRLREERSLLLAITAEMMSTRDDIALLQVRLQHHVVSVEEEMMTVRHTLASLSSSSPGTTGKSAQVLTQQLSQKNAERDKQEAAARSSLLQQVEQLSLQQAAAWGRLQQLQQQQLPTTEAVSPPISPIPPLPPRPSLSTPSPEGSTLSGSQQRLPQVSMELPDLRKPRTHTQVDVGAGVISDTVSHRADNKDGGGWFALSHAVV
ncbi:spindle and centriole-associated protein 1 [Lethenteron reissneri]|uniref:spindle and centriole-associated protein 1 n=1 Tax=Lethenteron reissneri TaxID=7753 RepID=UPI002AB72D12|nr:spindle and centriole-associated protein 1 [Lethenteron reissneri]